MDNIERLQHQCKQTPRPVGDVVYGILLMLRLAF